CCSPSTKEVEDVIPAEISGNYITSRAPLKQNPYIELPLGAIRAHGWLDEQLQNMAKGMTGNLDKIYPEVVGDRNGWLGGHGDRCIMAAGKQGASSSWRLDAGNHS